MYNETYYTQHAPCVYLHAFNQLQRLVIFFLEIYYQLLCSTFMPTCAFIFHMKMRLSISLSQCHAESLSFRLIHVDKFQGKLDCFVFFTFNLFFGLQKLIAIHNVVHHAAKRNTLHPGKYKRALHDWFQNIDQPLLSPHHQLKSFLKILWENYNEIFFFDQQNHLIILFASHQCSTSLLYLSNRFFRHQSHHVFSIIILILNLVMEKYIILIFF